MAREESDRIRSVTEAEINRRIDREIENNILYYAQQGKRDLAARIAELDEEWDIERVLQAHGATIAFAGVAMSVLSGRKWLALPAIVLPFLFQHARSGWCPPVPILRRLGVRTRMEIDKEKFALKALRGDFHDVVTDTRKSAATRAELALEAALK